MYLSGMDHFIKISIHALREEGDFRTARRFPHDTYFYPRPPRGGRLLVSVPGEDDEEFLSTPSARRATAGRFLAGPARHYFYPRPPRGGRRALHIKNSLPCIISIHALREEGDPACSMSRRCYTISIHALREEGDTEPLRFPPNPSLFLSTPSARRATFVQDFITARRSEDFYPRPPRGGRRGCWSTPTLRSYFYPRPPRGGRRASSALDFMLHIFLSTPSARRATITQSSTS